jgi:pimeloyl-ACP methyl ester carboxylesterase
MRAIEPARAGHVEQDGVRLHWEEFGAGDPTIVLLPTWSIVHSRHWKFQVPFLSRHYRVITFDGRGCGRSDRPAGAASYGPRIFAADTRAVLDATGTEQAVLVSFSAGALWAFQVAVDDPARVLGLVTIAPAVPLAPLPAERTTDPFEKPSDNTDGWAKYNRHYWDGDYRGFLDFFFDRVFTEPHSTKVTEDAVGWGLETDPATLADAHRGLAAANGAATRSVAARVRPPVLVIHGHDDAVRPYAAGVAVAELTGGSLVTIEGGGHAPHCRDPIVVNRLIRQFVDGTRR